MGICYHEANGYPCTFHCVWNLSAFNYIMSRKWKIVCKTPLYLKGSSFHQTCLISSNLKAPWHHWLQHQKLLLHNSRHCWQETWYIDIRIRISLVCCCSLTVHSWVFFIVILWFAVLSLIVLSCTGKSSIYSLFGVHASIDDICSLVASFVLEPMSTHASKYIGTKYILFVFVGRRTFSEKTCFVEEIVSFKGVR